MEELLAAAIVIFANSTDDICPDPIPGDDREPAFCQAVEDIRLITPYHSVQIDAGLYVGVSAGGIGITIQDSPALEQVQMRIGLGEPWEQITSYLRRCDDFHMGRIEGLVCGALAIDGNEEYFEKSYYIKNELNTASGGTYSTQVELNIKVDDSPLILQFERLIEMLELSDSQQFQG